MYKKLSVLDRKIRPGSARPNLESADEQYQKEQEKLRTKQMIHHEAHERVRRCYDPEENEKSNEQQIKYQSMQEQLAYKEYQRHEDEVERKREVDNDLGYRNYTGGAQPWTERATPFSGSDAYEAQLRREYLRELMTQNQAAEASKNAYKRYETEATRHQDRVNQSMPTFYNKDIDNSDKYWSRSGLYHKGSGAAAGHVSHHVTNHTFEWNKPVGGTGGVFGAPVPPYAQQ